MGNVDIAKASDLTAFGRDRGSGATLPTTGNRRGDVFFHTVPGYLVVWNGTAWVPNGNEGFPYARMRQTTVQSGLGVGWANILMHVKDFDTHNGMAGVGVAHWTVPPGHSGLYRVEGAVSFTAARASEVFATRLMRGQIGTTDLVVPATQQHTGNYNAGGGPMLNTGSHFIQLNAGQFVWVQGYSSQAGWGTSIGAGGNEGVGIMLQVERVR